MAIVSIKSQQVTFYDAEGWIFRAPVSTGTTGRETPAGVFAIIEKDKDHHSTMYDDAWMPNMQRITWNGIALHGGPLPGYAASHGCVRMPFGFAEGLFDKTNIGMRVIISPNDAAPIDIVHPALFMPKRDAIAAAPGQIGRLSGEAEEATRAADEAKKAATAAAKEAASLPASLRKLEQQKTRADAELAFADRQLAAAKTDQARAKAEELKQKAATKAADAATQLDAAKSAAQPKRDAVAATKEAAKAAAARKADAVKAATDAKLALEPVSVYISRATQKLYVRRNTHKPAPDGGGEVFDTSIEVPVAIRNPDQPLGTHIFTAMGEDRHRPALERGHDRRQRQRQERTRPHHHPTGGARSHRADRVAALLDHHLGRAAEQRDQLPHRVRRSAEQPAPGRFHHAQADRASDGHGER
ncbi:chemotaxis protein histidine kinase CheA [Bradyrhizobium sp. GM7.3]